MSDEMRGCGACRFYELRDAPARSAHGSWIDARVLRGMGTECPAWVPVGEVRE